MTGLRAFKQAVAVRSNLAVDTDAQLRTLPAVAPVGRRSPLRYTASAPVSLERGVLPAILWR